MATRFLDKVTTVSTANTRNLPDAAGIAYETTDGVVKYNDGGTIRTVVNTDEAQTLTNKTINSPVVSGNTPVAGGASLTLTAAAHGGKTILMDTASGTALTLPAATGTGVKFRIFISTTVTSNAHTVSVVGNDAMFGNAVLFQDGGDTMVGFEAGADTDKISMNGTTTGGLKGGFIELEDVATDTWSVFLTSAATSTEATPFQTGQIT